MKYAIIEAQGKQVKVSVGDKIVVDRVDTEVGEVVDLPVLLVREEAKTIIGTPVVEKQTLGGKVIEHIKGEKIRVATYKSKSRYRRVKGHRQAQTVLEIVESKASKPAQKAKTTTTKKTKTSTSSKKKA